MKVCYLLVTCSREASRDSMLRAVVKSLKEQPAWEDWKDDFYVFDNDSTYGDTRNFLKSEFKNVMFAGDNYGYWSAVNWFSHWARKKGYQYVYIMESDCVHFNIEQLNDAVRFLGSREDVGMVRTAEFSLANKHLYDKNSPFPESKTSEWFQQSNYFTKKSAVFLPTTVEGVYETNLVAKVCGLHRLEVLKLVLSKLSGWFIEADFQREYHDLFPMNAILDGGMYNSTLAYGPQALAGSLVRDKMDENGYRKTREGFITPLDKVKVDFE